MKFTDIFIRRPVLASVVSLLILLLGVRSIDSLQVRQYPEMKNTVVTVTTAYPGASSDLVKGFITTPLQQAIAEADGIDYMTSTSTQGTSTIEAHMVLNYDPNAAVSEIQAKVASKRNVLPAAAEDPVIDSTTGQRTALMYMAFYSDTMASSQITDYLLRVVQPKLQAIHGVSKAQIIGNKTFAMRVWLDPKRMAALNVTPQEVVQVLLANNYQAGVGQTKGSYVAIDLSANTDISNQEDFRNLVVRSDGDTLVRIRDIADAKLGAEDYNSINWYKGKTAIFIGIEQAPSANPLNVAQRVHDAIPGIRAQLPAALAVELPYDASEFIQDSIHEVFRTIAESLLIVLVVIFLIPGLPARGHDPRRGGAPVAHRRGLHHAGAGLLVQPAHPARHGPGHRAGGGRRHHRGGEHPPSYRERRIQVQRGDQGRPRAGAADHRHDHHPGGRVRPHRLHEGPGRLPVHRVRLRPGRGRGDLRAWWR